MPPRITLSSGCSTELGDGAAKEISRKLNDIEELLTLRMEAKMEGIRAELLGWLLLTCLITTALFAALLKR